MQLNSQKHVQSTSWLYVAVLYAALLLVPLGSGAGCAMCHGADRHEPRIRQGMSETAMPLRSLGGRKDHARPENGDLTNLSTE